MQLSCAGIYARDSHPLAAQPIWRGEIYQHDRIRVAYLSADFRVRAVSSSVAEIWERHD